MHRAEKGAKSTQSSTTVGGRSGALLSWLAIGYNCQGLPARRPIEQLTRELNGDIVGLQGTKRQATVQSLTVPARYAQCVCEDRAGYRAWHWPKPHLSDASDPRGVAVAIRKSRLSGRVRTAATGPKNPRLQGRGGMVRIRAAGRFDIAAVVVYPPAGNDAASRRDYSDLSPQPLRDWERGALL